MSRDRLAGIRTQRDANQANAAYNQAYPPQQGGYSPNQQSSPQSGQAQYSPQNAYEQPSAQPGGTMQDFFAEIDSLQQAQAQLKDNIGHISHLHSVALNDTNDASHAQAQQQLADMTSQTSRLTANIKNRITALSTQTDRLPVGGETNTRRLQVATQKKRFMALIQEYQEVERKSREQYKTRMERQYKIVKPDATQDEINQAISSEGGQQVFANALMTSNRYGDARNAFREVQERHEDIKKISQTMNELAQLMNDMAMLIEKQDEQVIAIEASAQDAEQNMAQANVQLEKGVKSARAARRKRWIFFGIFILIIAILALVLGIYFGKK